MPLHILAGFEVADDAAAGGHLHPPRAGNAAQICLELLFEAVLADLVARRDEQRIGVFLELLGRSGADIADQVADARRCRIEARKTALGHHALQIGEAHADGCELFEIQAACHLDRLKPAPLGDLGLDIGDPRRLEPEQGAEPVDRAFGIDHPFGNDIDPEIGAVRGERGTIAIKDPSAPRRNQREIDAVALGFEPVFLVLGNREIGEAPGQQHADPALDCADQHRPPLEHVAQDRGVDDLCRPLRPLAAQER